MIILDTNVLSAVMFAERNERVVRWLDKYHPDEVFTTTINIFEIVSGIEYLLEGPRKQRLEEELQWLLSEGLRSRILGFDHGAARIAGEMIAYRKSIGRPIGLPDLFLGSIAVANNAGLVTRNTKDFTGFKLHLIDPWADELQNS